MDWLFSNVTTPSFNPMFEISSLWVYTLLDLDGDGEDELFLHPRDAQYTHLIFDARPEELELVGQKTIRMSDWTDPLLDGRILETLHYDGMYTYTIRDLSSQEENVWTYRYEDRLYYVGEEPESPAWTHNGQPVTEMEFEDFLLSCQEKRIPYWNTVHFHFDKEES